MPNMMQASQTAQKEKAPSAPTLKGFGLFDAGNVCVWITAPCGAFFQTAMTSIEVISMQYSSHAGRSRSSQKLRWTQNMHVMAPIEDQGTWNAAP